MTVNVYVVVAVGVTFTAVPLVAVPTLLLTLPVPLAKTAVSVVEVPAVMVRAPGVKLVITGASTTVTVAWAVTDAPAAFVTVSVYVAVDAGETLTPVPVLTVPTPLFMLPVPPLNTPVRLVEFPTVIVPAAAAKLVIDGAATTFSVNDCCAFGVCPLFAVIVIG